MSIVRARGFTLVEVLVALMIVAIGLAALMVAVSGTARTSGYLRDKTLAQWIALNRVSELRLNINKSGLTVSTKSTLSTGSADATEIKFANRTWHYDTRYFDTSIESMKRIVVRVYAGEAKTKGNPLAECTSFIGTALAAPGSSNASDWTSLERPPLPNNVQNTQPGAQAFPQNPAANPASPTQRPVPVPLPGPQPTPEALQ